MSAPLCIDCAWSRSGGASGAEYHGCYHESLRSEKSLVDGHSMIRPVACGAMRGVIGSCGPAGTLFSPRWNWWTRLLRRPGAGKV